MHKLYSDSEFVLYQFTYIKLDVKHISMAILCSNTYFFASSLRKVACPSRSGPNDNNFIVSSGVFCSVCANDKKSPTLQQQQKVNY